ncbi:MAG: histidine phosphatase family protein [Owenweeksia sp.]
MKKLYLVRHAKSSWKEEGVHDMDRPLKGRGVRDAYNTSQWLQEQGDKPEFIISSPATRALHTALIFSKNLEYSFSDIQIEKKIYHASTKDLLRLVRGLKDDFNSIMLFGHNPTITDFVNRCIDHRIDNVPTTGVACLRFEEESWANIDKKAELVFFDYPKRRKSS